MSSSKFGLDLASKYCIIQLVRSLLISQVINLDRILASKFIFFEQKFVLYLQAKNPSYAGEPQRRKWPKDKHTSFLVLDGAANNGIKNKNKQDDFRR